jgi:hypothetical protein
MEFNQDTINIIIMILEDPLVLLISNLTRGL